MASISVLKPSFFKVQYWQKWFRTAKTDNNIATLNPRQIYILPTRWGLLYAVMLVLLLVGSINYSISMGYYVTFLLASLGNMAMLHTWRNLVHLQATLLSSKPVFSGHLAQVPLHIIDSKNRARYAITAQFEDNDLTSNGLTSSDIASNTSQAFYLPLQTQKRGLQTLPRIKLYTEFPLLLFHAWAYVESPQQILVYAKPSDSNVAPPLSNIGQPNGKNHSAHGDEDFDGHKTYQTGDAPSRVDWKASSRGIGMFSKQYTGNGSATLLLDWEMTTGVDVEARISLLTKWVIDAHAAKQQFGLKLPSISILPDDTEAHYHEVLRELALM